jgi:hypothetical protein
MKNSRKVIIAISVVLVVGIAGLLIINGISAKEKYAYPPCDQLPKTAEVQDALNQHPDLAIKIASGGQNIHVRVGHPCSTDPDAALIEVTYSTEQEEAHIRDTLMHADGFGVPTTLKKR